MANSKPKKDADSKKKNKVCSKVYIRADGTESSSAHDTATELQFRFHDGPGGEVKTVHAVKIGDNPLEIETCLAWFGRSEKYGNFYAGAKGDAAAAVEMFVTGQEILVGGEWKERKEGAESRPSMVLAAVIAFVEADGETVDDARKARLKEKVSTTEGRKRARANPKIELEYQKILSAHQATKEKAAKEKAKGATVDTSEYK